MRCTKCKEQDADIHWCEGCFCDALKEQNDKGYKLGSANAMSRQCAECGKRYCCVEEFDIVVDCGVAPSGERRYLHFCCQDHLEVYHDEYMSQYTQGENQEWSEV